jgi:hypothetical protein
MDQHEIYIPVLLKLNSKAYTRLWLNSTDGTGGSSAAEPVNHKAS